MSIADIEEISVSSKKNILLFLEEIEKGTTIDKAKRKYKVFLKNNIILKKYAQLMNDAQISLLTYKPVRSWSGVLVITVVMRPDKFSCPYNCYYCPNEPGQPRSYLSNEPAVSRANEVHFDAVFQMFSRLDTLRQNGHTVDKLEIIVLGGTFSAYPRDYQREFIRDLFFAANNYNKHLDFAHNCSVQESKVRQSLSDEQNQNTVGVLKIIGISLETRPDHINKYEIKRLRDYGCTRVQLGVQHTDNKILDIVNRGHHVEQSVKAIRMLRCNGFKIDIHIMPDLPGATPEKDKTMITRVLTSPEFMPDYLKIYPCLDVDFTEIRQWKRQGRWKPYADSDNGQLITDVILHAKKLSQIYMRYNRIQRDFCEEREGVLGYESKNIRSNFRQMLHDEMKKHGISCRCIRCKEVKNNAIDPKMIFYNLTRYNTHGGTEYFISCHSGKYLLGFVRLRINTDSNDVIYDSLKDAAFIRELHVYGQLLHVGSTTKQGAAQHLGIGKRLMSIALAIASAKGYTKIAVISGIGVRDYYQHKHKFILHHEGHYMIRRIKWNEGLYYIVYATMLLLCSIFVKIKSILINVK